ncbi:fumarylacetoacetate hydrolase family protein [Aestuariirhabdus sp. Z084]|uniref:fumarylacetoacetate hydrolase family protein n=1 Tax=Aestuariirhabdus haliotis TaxID=2918751 RepID=UPI00201B3FCB|nr:fumarylacetoacetate hydrolase family protein [Aestuariirhabdus haliotis]MCL6415013.1 fumarylacetoacetate hydrolase family protein [Aestuariirhabdus haliotis]MCL6418945.1 fumarylacetoacetate hydrolase family protein [Aestuariirhabdus haliotis]
MMYGSKRLPQGKRRVWYIRVLCLAVLLSPTMVFAEVDYLVRFEHEDSIRYGRLVGETIQPLSGGLFGERVPTGQSLPLSTVKLLMPTEPQKVFAVGMNFSSHIASSGDLPPPLFLKLPTSLIASGEPVHLPVDARNVHFEGELVLVIGQQAKELTEAEAVDVIFGVTVGNDLTERGWQGSDLQWLRAKASDGFGPVGPIIARGVDYNNLLLTTRLNGQVVQQENTRNMIHKPAKVVSYLSRYFTLMPGDLVFMGTPGRTQALSDGDVVSVTIDQVGMVENRIQQ